MAVRQYIGARYVPLLDGDWISTKEYEPLTVVSDANGNSYTSRKKVPAGTPLNNLEYWQLTGAYSQQVASLTTRVSSVEIDVEQLKTDVDDIKIKTNKKYIFVADSYGTPVDNFIRRATSVIGLIENIDYCIIAHNGSGFIGSSDDVTLKWQNMIRDTQITIPINDITDIVVLGGANDWNSNVAAIITAIGNFCTNARAKYINAKIHIGMIGFSKFSSARLAMKDITLVAYSRCGAHGAEYISNSEYVLKNQRFLQDDYHPNATGHSILGYALASYLVNGNMPKTHVENTPVSLTDLTGVNHSTLPDVKTEQCGNTVRLHINGVVRSASTSDVIVCSKTTLVPLFKLAENPFMSNTYYQFIAYLFYDTGASQVYFPTIVRIDNGTVSIQTLYTGDSLSVLNIQFINIYLELNAMDT